MPSPRRSSAPPAVVSFALDDAGDLMRRVHDAGSLVMQQVTTVQQAQLAAEHGADIIVAQGGEAGGYGGVVSTLSLVPQVVDAVRPVPVVAAGGIADGRGIAAAMVLGAAGVNLGSRFLASVESPVGERWKKALVTCPSEEWIQAGFINVLNPNPGTVGYGTRVRLLRTEFVAALGGAGRRASRPTRRRCWPSSPRLTPRATESEVLVVGGQSAGLIGSVEPAGAIVRALVAEARDRARRGRPRSSSERQHCRVRLRCRRTPRASRRGRPRSSRPPSRRS